MKRWELAKQNESLYRELLMRTDINSLCASVLSSRGYDNIDEISDFLNASELEDPFSLIDMEKAVDAITGAVENGELICVYGDYDCDGITATVILYNYLENMDACVMYYIPEREEGYGLNNSAIDKMKDNGVKLIITVDNGISAIDEAEYKYEATLDATGKTQIEVRKGTYKYNVSLAGYYALEGTVEILEEKTVDLTLKFYAIMKA